MITPPAHVQYRWRGGAEWMLVHGDGPRDVLIVPPLFEEANFLRAFLADLARALAAAGCTAWLPDLPGLGESLLPLETIRLPDWIDAITAASAQIAQAKGHVPHLYALRGGGLLLPPDQPAFVHAAVSGDTLIRTMERAEQLGDNPKNAIKAADIERLYLMGYCLSGALAAELRSTVPPYGPLVHSRNPAPAEPLLWRRTEPARDQALAIRIADEIVAWAAICAAR